MEKNVPFIIMGKSLLAIKMGQSWHKKSKRVKVSLLWKWVWELGNGEDNLWKRIIFDKYGKEMGDWSTRRSDKPYGCGFWKGIMLSKEFFESNISYQDGNRARVRF